MAKYKKVKRYHRSFYSPGMWVKKAVGIIVLVAVVLVVGWLAAPHVLDWATHTWYTVVRNRDLSASSETTASSAAASSEVTAEPAASSEVRADSEPESEPAAPAGVIIEGSWGVLDTAAAKDEASLRAAAQQLAQQGAVYAVVTLKDSAGNILYPSQVAAAAGSIEGASLDPALIASVLKENSLVPVAKLAAFRDPIAARTDRNMAIGYTGQAYLWLDNKASAGGNPWLNPYSDEAVQFIGDLIGEVQSMGFDHVLLENVQFPSAQNGKQDFGSTGGRDRSAQLAGSGDGRRFHRGRLRDGAGRQEPRGRSPRKADHGRRRPQRAAGHPVGFRRGACRVLGRCSGHFPVRALHLLLVIYVRVRNVL